MKVYKSKGETGIQDTYPRKNYVLKDDRCKRFEGYSEIAIILEMNSEKLCQVSGSLDNQ